MGDRAAARTRLREYIRFADEHGMFAYANMGRLRYTQFADDDYAAEALTQSRAWTDAQLIRNPYRFAGVIAPGLVAR